jgi:hypothetical protein
VYRVLLLMLAGWLGFGLLAQPAKEKLLGDNEFKAAFLSKIPPYIQWPASAFSESENDLVVGILGPDPIAGLVEQLLRGKQIDGRRCLVKVFNDPESIPRNCHILFVPASQKQTWQQWSKANPQPQGLLSVGETEDFITKMGGVFNLSVSERKLEISLHNARKAGLEIDSRLLKMAKVIR